MMSCMMRAGVLSITSALLAGVAAAAGPTDAQKCEADKLRRTAKYAFCRMKAESKFAKKGDSAKLTSDLAKCDAKITGKFAKAEARWGGECPTTGDVGAIQSRVSADSDDLAVLLSGGTLPPVCGNGTIDPGEQCDFGNLDGETCDSRTASGEPFGTLSCDPGTCTFDTSGCVPRFEDTGLTVIDHETGLEWEKKTGVPAGTVAASDCPGGPHCGDLTNVNNRFTWSVGGQWYDGTAVTLFLDGLNDVAGGGANCFAGRCDWRLPTLAKPDQFGAVAEGEWESIVDCSGGGPCLDPNLGPNSIGHYWSSTANVPGPWASWTVDFNNNGFVGVRGKPEHHYVRAVRGGS